MKNKLPVFTYSRKTRSWSFTFVGWDNSERTVRFVFEKSIKGLTPELVHTDLHDGFNIGVYDKDSEDTLLTTLRIDYPNLWPDRDPHQVFTEKEIMELLPILVREVHGSWLRRLADGWFNAAAKRSNALEFELQCVADKESEDAVH